MEHYFNVFGSNNSNFLLSNFHITMLGRERSLAEKTQKKKVKLHDFFNTTVYVTLSIIDQYPTLSYTFINAQIAIFTYLV